MDIMWPRFRRAAGSCCFDSKIALIFHGSALFLRRVAWELRPLSQAFRFPGTSRMMPYASTWMPLSKPLMLVSGPPLHRSLQAGSDNNGPVVFRIYQLKENYTRFYPKIHLMHGYQNFLLKNQRKWCMSSLKGKPLYSFPAKLPNRCISS